MVTKMERKHEEEVAHYEIEASNSKLRIQAQTKELSLISINSKSDAREKQKFYSAQVQEKNVSINALQKECRGGIDVLVATCKQLVSGFAEAAQDVAKSNIAVEDAEATASRRLKKVRECQEKISELRDRLIFESKERCKLSLENEVLEMKMQEMKNDYERRIRDLTPRILARDWKKRGHGQTGSSNL